MSATRHRLLAMLDRYDERVARLQLPPEGLVIIRRWLADGRESALHSDEEAVQRTITRIEDVLWPNATPRATDEVSQ